MGAIFNAQVLPVTDLRPGDRLFMLPDHPRTVLLQDVKPSAEVRGQVEIRSTDLMTGWTLLDQREYVAIEPRKDSA